MPRAKHRIMPGARYAGKVALLDVNGPEATFQAPQLSEARTYRFKLRVTDRKGADSVPAFVDVTVEP